MCHLEHKFSHNALISALFCMFSQRARNVCITVFVIHETGPHSNIYHDSYDNDFISYECYDTQLEL